MTTFSKSVELPVSAKQAFAWHERPGAFTRLTPPWENVRLLDAKGGIRDGAKVVVRVNALGPLGFTAVYRHSGYQPGVQFVDEQEKGPFRSWRHEHRFHAGEDDTCVLEDHITFQAPPMTGGIVTKRLDRMFTYRHTMTLNDLAYEARNGPVKPQCVLISGASGLVGRALAARLTTRGHQVKTLSRRPQENGIVWDPAKGLLPEDALDDVDTVIHLAGESIAQRWTPAVRTRIMDSRVDSSRLLVDAILKSGRNITYLASSGINYYGNQKDTVVTEDSPSGSGYLAEVCRAWEAAADPLVAAGLRCAFMRTGVVLSARGGALAKMLPAFRAGVAGRIGSGDQVMSWVALDDLVDQFLSAVENPGLSGPINAVAPTSLTNRAFTKALGAALKRPTIFPVPAAPLRMLLGGMAEETILADLSVQPAKLQDQAFVWRFPDLDQLLRHELGR